MATHGIQEQGIERFAWVEPWLARGGQPDAADLRWLHDHGIRVVVNLRTIDEGEFVRSKMPELESVQIPVKNDLPPTPEQTLQWIDLCSQSAPAKPIFVHCRGGEGRTSLFCACVRLAQGWSVEAAIDEQRTFGFKPETEHAEQAAFLRSFAPRVPKRNFG